MRKDWTLPNWTSRFVQACQSAFRLNIGRNTWAWDTTRPPFANWKCQNQARRWKERSLSARVHDAFFGMDMATYSSSTVSTTCYFVCGRARNGCCFGATLLLPPHMGAHRHFKERRVWRSASLYSSRGVRAQDLTVAAVPIRINLSI